MIQSKQIMQANVMLAMFYFYQIIIWTVLVYKNNYKIRKNMVLVEITTNQKVIHEEGDEDYNCWLCMYIIYIYIK